jgi:hypothetical protein
MTVKRSIDVEKLLHWAFRDELPKSTVGSDVSPMFANAALGVQVDKSGGEPGFPAAMGTAHPDAFLIERVVNDLQSIEVEWPASRDLIAPEFGAMLGEGDVSIWRLHVPVAVYVISHARMGNRPQWSVDAWRLRRQINSINGKVRVEGLGPKSRVQEGSFCPLTCEPDPREVVADRAIYGGWHHGLCQAAAALRDSPLERWIVTGPAISAAPWLYPDPQPVILQDLSVSATSRAVRRPGARRRA